MNWDQIREWQAAGFGVGSQTQTHPHMHRIPIEDSRRELEVSNERFLAELGLRPMLFAYPYGEYNRAVLELVRKQASKPLSARIPGWHTGITGFSNCRDSP